MAIKFSFFGKKTLSKRAAALLDEINQSKGVETIKEAKQALSKRAAAILDEINQSKGVETIKEVSKLVTESLGMEAEETKIPEAPPTMSKRIVSRTKKININYLMQVAVHLIQFSTETLQGGINFIYGAFNYLYL